MARGTETRSGYYVTEAVAEQGPDKTTRIFVIGIAAIIILILTVLLYGLIAGVLNPPAPRTAVEFALERAERTVNTKEATGMDWADYAILLHQSGSKRDAAKAIERGRKAIKDGTVVYIDNAEVQNLLAEEKWVEAEKAAKKAWENQLKIRKKQAEENAQRGISIPAQLRRDQNKVSIDTLVMWSTALKNQNNKKKADEAIKLLGQAIALDNTASDVITMRGYLYLDKGDKAMAKRHFDEALVYYPDYEPALEGLKKVAAAKDTKSKASDDSSK